MSATIFNIMVNIVMRAWMVKFCNTEVSNERLGNEKVQPEIYHLISFSGT